MLHQLITGRRDTKVGVIIYRIEDGQLIGRKFIRTQVALKWTCTYGVVINQ
jgi:hypothetical protein